MDISELKAFVEVAQQNSFSRAAENLFLTQPAISKRIAALEQDLDARLFDRVGRRVTLTEAGTLLLASARRILQEMETCRYRIRNQDDTIGGRLSIATSHHVGLHRLPPVLRRFSSGFPDVELDLHFMDSEVACQAVEAAQLELAVVTLPANPGPRLVTRIIWPDPLDLVVGAEHPLAMHGLREIDQLCDYPAILPAHGTFTRLILEQALVGRGRPLQVALESNYLETIKMMVSVGLGWSVLPRSMVGTDLVAVGREQVHMHRDLGLIRHTDRSLSRAARAFIDVLEVLAPGASDRQTS